MSLGFSSDDRSVLDRTVQDVNTSTLTIDQEDLDDVFEIPRCVDWIQKEQKDVVALQFPDALLSYAPRIASRIQQTVVPRVAILGDTSYGECCVDEVAAEHIGAESVIHFGHTCMTPTQRLPVLHVFTKLPVDPVDLQQRVANYKNVYLFYDVQYHHQLKTFLSDNVTVCHPGPGPNRCGRVVPEGKPETVVYVGNNDHYEMMLALAFSEAEMFTYLPSENLFHSSGANVRRTLMKRYSLIEKTKDASRIGILVGTLGAASYSDIIDCVRQTVRKSGRKVYTFLVGKPNVAKLANFPEIDVFVLVACPESSVSGSIFDSVDYFKPVISPYELDVALNKGREWGQDGYLTDFKALLPGSKHFKEFEEDLDPDVSLLTGKMRNVRTDSSDGESEYALATQETRISELHRQGGGEFLSQKSWQGLEQKLGQTPVTMATKGQTGIPMEYKQLE